MSKTQECRYGFIRLGARLTDSLLRDWLHNARFCASVPIEISCVTLRCNLIA